MDQAVREHPAETGPSLPLWESLGEKGAAVAPSMRPLLSLLKIWPWSQWGYHPHNALSFGHWFREVLQVEGRIAGQDREGASGEQQPLQAQEEGPGLSVKVIQAGQVPPPVILCADSWGLLGAQGQPPQVIYKGLC